MNKDQHPAGIPPKETIKPQPTENPKQQGLVVPDKPKRERFRPKDLSALSRITSILKGLSPEGRKWVLNTINYFEDCDKEETCPETPTPTG